MAMTQKDKEQVLPEVKKVKDDPENLHISREQFEAKRRKQKEHDKRLADASEKIKAEIDAEDGEKKESGEDEVQTVKHAKHGPKKHQ